MAKYVKKRKTKTHLQHCKVHGETPFYSQRTRAVCVLCYKKQAWDREHLHLEEHEESVKGHCVFPVGTDLSNVKIRYGVILRPSGEIKIMKCGRSALKQGKAEWEKLQKWKREQLDQ